MKFKLVLPFLACLLSSSQLSYSVQCNARGHMSWLDIAMLYFKCFLVYALLAQKFVKVKNLLCC